MSFYTSVDKIGDKIFHRFIDNQGNRKSQVVKTFPISLYVQGKETKNSCKGIMGEILNPVEFSIISEAEEFIENYKNVQDIYGQTNLLYQFISLEYPNDIQFDFNQIKIFNFDIETSYTDEGFPTPDLALQPIISIACKVFGKENPMMVFGLKEFSGKEGINYTKCDDEKELLIHFQEYWRSINPEIVTGWNVEGFDIPYLINRCNKILGEDFSERFSNFSGSCKYCISDYHFEKFDKKNKSYKILGITIIDYMDLYKKFATKVLESYRLDFIGQYELEEGKINYEEYGGLMGLYEKNPDKFTIYNARDVEIVEKLENKLNFLFLALTIAYLGKVKYNDIYSQIRFWDTHIYNFLLKKNIQIPPNKHKKDFSIVGAYVKDPIPSLYEWVVTLDLTSLYPSIIMSFNLSPETQRGIACHDINNIENYISMNEDLNFAKDSNVCVIANGSIFTRDFQGIFPHLVEEMFTDRKKFKNLAIQTSKEIERMKLDISSIEEIQKKKNEEATFDAKQMALKTVLNSLFGVSANPYFRYSNKNIAEGITMTGQLIIRFIFSRLNIFLNKQMKTEGFDFVISGDTDSCFINLKPIVDKIFKENQEDKIKIVNFIDKYIKTYIHPFLEQEFDELTKYLNAYTNKISMKREVIADKLLLRGKKNYILQMYDKEGIRYQEPKLKMMGVETAKSSTPKIVRGSLEKAIRIILNNSEKDLQKYVLDFNSKFQEVNISEISFPRGVSNIDKWSDSEGNPIKGTPIHIKGVLSFNTLLKQKNLEGKIPRIHNGDKIKFAYLVKQNPLHSNVIAFIDELPKEFGLHQFIDRQLQFEKTFLEPLKSFTQIVGWSPEKINSLESFWS